MEFTFSMSSVGRLALGLHLIIRQGQIALRADDELLDELAAVRLIKNTLGVYRLDHDSGAHDDQAVAVALAVHHLLEAEPGASFPIFDDVEPCKFGLVGAPEGLRAVQVSGQVIAFVAADDELHDADCRIPGLVAATPARLGVRSALEQQPPCRGHHHDRD